jgi:hypothetical protein
MPPVAPRPMSCLEIAFFLGVYLCAGMTAPGLTKQLTGSARTALAIVQDIRTRRPVVDLGADDFVVQEGGDSREVLSVRPADYPVVLMIDTSAPPDDLPFIRKAAKQFVERLGSERPIAVGAFDNRARMIAVFDGDRTELTKQLDQLATASGGASMSQALRLATETLASSGAPFSSIVMLSAGPGEDAGHSSAGEEPDAAAAVVASGAILHVVAHRPARSDGTIADSTGAGALRLLAEQSRGEFIAVYTPASFEAALVRIAARMTSELMVEYLVPNQSRAGDVKLGVRLPGAQVRGLGVR